MALPVVSGVVDFPDPFSPNGDHIKDEVTIGARLNEAGTIAVTIKNSLGSVVRTFPAQAAGPNLPLAQKRSEVSFTAPLNGTDDLQVSGNFAYFGTDNDLGVIEFTNPATPVTYRASLGTGSGGATVGVAGSFAYVPVFVPNPVTFVTDMGLAKVNISNPRMPVLDSVTNLRPTVASLRPNIAIREDGTRAYIVQQAASREAEVVSVDITGAVPTVKGTLSLDQPMGGHGFGTGVALKGNHLYVPADNGKIYIVDITLPDNPVLMTTIDMGAGHFPLKVAVSEDGAVLYATIGGEGLRWWDVTNPANPMELTVSFPGGEGAMEGIEVAGSVLYVAEVVDAVGSTRIAALDISDPRVPVIIGKIPLPVGSGPFTIRMAGDILLKSNGAIEVFEVHPAGQSTVRWDGKDVSGVTQLDGTYTYEIASVDTAGNSAPVQTGQTTLQGVAQSAQMTNGKPTVELLSNKPGITITQQAGADVAGAIKIAKDAGLTLVSLIFDIAPSGTTFSPPATLTFRYLHDLAEVDYRVYRFDGIQWLEVVGQTNNTASDFISASLPSVSFYGIFLRSRDSMPPVTRLSIDGPQAGLQDGTTAVSASSRFIFAAEDTANEGTPSGVASVGVRFVGVGKSTGPFSVFSGSTAVTAAVGVAEGLFRVEFFATDNAGNMEGVHASTFTMDATPPVGQLLSPSLV